MKIVGVSACIAGLAHTYMAKSSLDEHAEAAGHNIKIELQGAMGIENRLTQQEIDDADIVIFAVDTNVTNRDRFDGKVILEIPTQKAMREGQKVIKEAENMVKEEGSINE